MTYTTRKLVKKISDAIKEFPSNTRLPELLKIAKAALYRRHAISASDIMTEVATIRSTPVTYLPICPSPTFDPDGGELAAHGEQGHTVAISCSLAGATIRYNLGLTPATPTYGTIYTEPIDGNEIDEGGHVINAIAYKAGYTPSLVVTSGGYTLPPA